MFALLCFVLAVLASPLSRRAGLKQRTPPWWRAAEIGGSCPNVACLPSKNEIWGGKVAFARKKFGDSYKGTTSPDQHGSCNYQRTMDNRTTVSIIKGATCDSAPTVNWVAKWALFASRCASRTRSMSWPP